MSDALPVPAVDALVELLRTIGREEMLPRFGAIATERKADGSLVTAVDLAVQRRLTAGLATLAPGVSLLGEEMTAGDQARLLGAGESAVWVLDPLDGTSNFAAGYPGFAISLALIRGGAAVLGLVHDPVRDECFGARLGEGAWCDSGGTRRPIAPYSPGERLADCIATVDLKRLPPDLLPALFGAGSFRSQRNLGAVALDWCWLAAGRFQLYLHGAQSLWDYAAGRLIATEAGVPSRLFRRDGDRPDETLGLDKRVAIAAATPGLLEQWRERIALPLWRR